MPTTRHRLLLLAAAGLLLIVAACGGDDDGAQSTTSATTAASTDATEPMDHEDGESMDDMEHTDHEHGEGREWEGPGDAPVIDVSVTGNPEDGWDVAVDIAGEFTFTDVDTIEHVAGEGHTHLIVDGRVLGMVYEPTARIEELSPGAHTIEVTLASNDHSDYVVDGEVISGSTEVTVEGEAETPDVVVEIELAGGVPVEELGRVEVPLGSVVRLTVEGDISDEVHVHGYDVYGDLVAGQSVDIEFVADIPGVFEVELEGAGTLLVELLVS